MGGILASISALQATLAPKNRFGAVYGVDTSAVAAANAAAPMIGAGLAAGWGLHSVFLGAAAMYGLATVAVVSAEPSKASKTKRPPPLAIPPTASHRPHRRR